MIPASIYQYIYLLFITILTAICLFKYRVNEADTIAESDPQNLGFDKIVLIFLILFIGLRPVSLVFVDMFDYAYQLQYYEGNQFIFSLQEDNILFDNLFKWWGCNGIGQTSFFVFIASVYFGCSYIGIKRLFPNHVLIAYLVFLAAFSTFSYATNGIKAGAATSIFIMALGYLDNKWICIPLILVSYGFHHGMQVPIAAFVVSVIFRNPKYFYWGWTVCLLMSFLHITFFQELFGRLTDDQGAGYLLVKEDNTIGGIRFRPDFILYSAVPVWLGYQFEFKKEYELSRTYSTLLHFYITANAVWMLCMYASFNNRIAYLSWFVYPIVILYPYFDPENQEEDRFLKLSRVVKFHLLFTLFMVFVYYGYMQLGH